MTGNQIRSAFLDFFSNKNHQLIRSSSLIPLSDPTLLFTNAGMVQFKDVFTGIDKRNYNRATTSQKCLRVSGKHNDLENVGRTARHHTFFEMLGNFSFGDYFKESAIEFAWEFLVGRLGLDSERIWVTVFLEDDEAEEIWSKKIGVPSERIVRMGEKDNFWSMGETGPCGPCSELIFDQGPELHGSPPGTDDDGDRFLELWNLVFMQYDRDSDGNLNLLPKPSVDTGMGLERLVSILQGENSNFHTDLLMPVIKFSEDKTGIRYEESESDTDVSFRVIADHSRAISFLICDGIMPSNEGRGYVLRKIARRAMRHARVLGIKDPFLSETASVLSETMGSAYPELRENLNYISKISIVEEERFSKTLAQGQPRMDELCDKARESDDKIIPGEEVFTLLDTYGYPLDLAIETSLSKGLKIGQESFDMAMNNQRERARSFWKGSGELAVDAIWKKLEGAIGNIDFQGYSKLSIPSKVLTIVKDSVELKEAESGLEVDILINPSPFYAESGGQEGDQGRIEWDSGSAIVLDTKKPSTNLNVIRILIERGELLPSQEILTKVDDLRRTKLSVNHTATHLLQYALREVLGDHVKQAGSHLFPDRLRFDFTHFASLSEYEREQVEDIVNQFIMQNREVVTREMSLDDALSIGATALFGERYGDDVRVVSIGDFSTELCGGTHVNNTGRIGLFRILQESSVASGVRRIEALAGVSALLNSRVEQRKLHEIRQVLKSGPDEEVNRVEELLERSKNLEKELSTVRSRESTTELENQIENHEEIDGVRFVAIRHDGVDSKEIRRLIDVGKSKIKSGVIIIISVLEGKISVAVGVTKDTLDRVHAGKLVGKIASSLGGKGGGRPDFAQAGGGKDIEKIDEVLSSISTLIHDGS
ncbi:MAG: alanine--tRNA ligase [Nitrospinota bacterium]|nr:alanine--tRNA ligase [Nitrospinota bacterium]